MKPFVFSIRGQYVDAFRAGAKRFEFRTRRPSVKAGERHLIYQTAPTARIVAVSTVGDPLVGTPAEIWAQTEEHAGITREEFDRYFSARTRAVAIPMRLQFLSSPLRLPACMTAPQAWARWRGPWPIDGAADSI